MSPGTDSDSRSASDFSARLDALAAAARAEARLELEARGFRIQPQGEWRGITPLPGGAPLEVVVRIPDSFPVQFPEVFVHSASLPRRIAHLEHPNASGLSKVCLVQTSGLLFDTSDPRGLIAEALERAARTVGDGLSGRSDPELELEFLAYWTGEGRTSILSIVDSEGPTRLVSLARLRNVTAFRDRSLIVADSAEQATPWASHLGGRADEFSDGFFISLESSFPPPDFGERVLVRAMLKLVSSHATATDAKQLANWLSRTSLPATVIVSLPAPVGGVGRILAAIRVEKFAGDTARGVTLGVPKRQATAGFRPGAVPLGRELEFSKNSETTRTAVNRLDSAFLTARGGASTALRRSSVVLIGVGAVGSPIADHLAAMGVGRAVLVDFEKLTAENVHRHSLGVDHIGEWKATAHAKRLSARFPHLEFEGRNVSIDEMLRREPNLITGADLVVIALGDETLERRLNELLHNGPPRLHAWLEPLGIGGHALLCGVPVGTVGCYECLFKPDSTHRFVNSSALTAPGQEIRHSLAGCAGTFSPFSALDSGRTALEAAQIAGGFLAGEERASVLFTWRGDGDAFERAGHQFSQRTALVPRGSRTRKSGSEFARQGCNVCSGTGTHQSPIVLSS